MAALFQSVGGGEKVTQQFRKDVGGAAMAAELYLAVGHLPVTLLQDDLQVVGDVPEVGWPAAEPVQVEVRKTRTQPGAGRRDAAMGEATHGNGMTQSRLRIGREQMQKTMQFLIPNFLELVVDALHFTLSPVLKFIQPGPAQTHMGQLAHDSRHTLGEQAA